MLATCVHRMQTCRPKSEARLRIHTSKSLIKALHVPLFTLPHLLQRHYTTVQHIEALTQCLSVLVKHTITRYRCLHSKDSAEGRTAC